MLLQKGFDNAHCASLDIGAGGDISHEVDILAEKIFIQKLGHFGKIHSEESGDVGEGDYVITLDPIDGSDNYLSQIPYYGSSIALEYKEEVLVGMICNFATGDIFVKTKEFFRVGHLEDLVFRDEEKNSCSTVGVFERAYRSKCYAKKLSSQEIKYRIPGASALSLAYAHRVDFVIFEGEIRDYDGKAGLFMCENLYKYQYNNLLIICKDFEKFNLLKNILLEETT